MSGTPPTSQDRTLDAGRNRRLLSGFFLAGMLMSFLGPILPAWGYHLRSDFSSAGIYFLSMALGILAAVAVARRLISQRGISLVLQIAAGLACAALLYLALVCPPLSSWWRISGVFLVGGSTGLLLSTLFSAITPIYRHDPAATVNIAGVLFVLGSLAMALLVAGTFYVYTVPSILFLTALIPALFAVMYFRTSFESAAGRPSEPSWKQTWQDFRSPTAVLLALLLFFQFGNEWCVAGWLAIFLIQRIGVSPASSLLLLALYWLALLVGRGLAQFLLARVSHGKLLPSSAFAALFGCVILSLTRNSFGAVSGILFIGGASPWSTRW